MKRITAIFVTLCCILMVQAQGSNRSSAVGEMDKLEELVDRFCRYVEVVGSTHSVSVEEKNKIRRDSVRPLFLDYTERVMITTSGTAGQYKVKKKMHDYFYNLQRQAGKARTEGRRVEVMYDLDFQFACDNGKLIWKYEGVTDEGIKKYSTKVLIYQTYMKQTKDGVEILRSRNEVDKKEMNAYKFVLPDGKTQLIKLYDITQVERMDTRN